MLEVGICTIILDMEHDSLSVTYILIGLSYVFALYFEPFLEKEKFVAQIFSLLFFVVHPQLITCLYY